MSLKIKTHALPLGYTELEYLQSTGSQYIDLGFKPNQTTKAICKFNYQEKPSYQAYTLVFGTRVQYGNNQFNAWDYSDDQASRGIRVDYANGENIYARNMQGTTGILTVGQDYTFELGHAYFNCPELSISNYQFPDTEGYQGDFECPNLYLFCINNNGSPQWFTGSRIKSFYAEHNGAPIRNLIPAKRNSDSVYGMYDLVSKTFFTNAGSGTFTAGPEVTEPTKPLKEVKELYKKNKNLVNISDGSATGGRVLKTFTSDEISKLVGKTITFSAYFKNITTTATTGCCQVYMVKNGSNVLGNLVGPEGGRSIVTTTIDSTVTSLVLWQSRGGGTTTAWDYYNIQLEEGSTATSYVPYGVDYIGEIYQKNPEWVVPDGYTQLEYITTTEQQNQYILTDLPIEETDKLTVGVLLKQPSSGDHYLATAGNNTWVDRTLSSWYVRFGSGGSVSTTGTPSGTIQTLDLYKEHFDIDGETILTPTFSGVNGNWSIFGINPGQISANCDLYSYKVTNTSTNEVRFNGIPAKRNSDNAIGIFDLVSNSFKPNAGTNAFTAGPEIPKTIHTFSAGYDTQITGTAPLTLPNARAKSTSWKIDGQSEQGVLPEGYTQLEYLESSGTQYIDTDIIPNSSTKIEVDCKRNSGTSFGALFGSRSVGPIKSFCSFYVSTDKIRFDYEQNDQKQALLPGSNVRVLLTKDGASNYIDGNLVNENTGSAFTGEYSIYLLQVNTGGSATSSFPVEANIYSCKIWQDGTTLSRHFIPAKNSSNVLGMYDLVSGNFFTNAGTGTFTAGPTLPTPTTPIDVKGCGNSGLPSGYKKLEYIESSGTQYINTGIIPTSATKTYVDYSIASFIGNGTCIGAHSGSSYDDHNYYPLTQNGAITTTKFRSVLGVSATQYEWESPLTNRHQILFNDNLKLYIDGNLVKTWTEFTSVPTNPIYLFWASGLPAAQYISPAKIYSCKIWQDGITLSRNFIPAQRKSDSVLGMYDTVTNTFFTNQGTGDFIAGPEDTSCVVPVMVNREVPDGYTQLEYIGTSGSSYTSGEYIDIGIPIHSNSKVEVKANWTNTVTDNAQNPTLFGCRSSSATMNEILLGTGPQMMRQYASITSSSVGTSSLSNISTYLIDANKTYIDGELKSTVTSTAFTNTQNMYVGCLNQLGTANRFVKADFYSVKVWQDGVTLVRNMIPAQRISDSVIGMYDTVSNTFFTNQGTGTFIAGPEVGIGYSINLPAPLQKIGTYKDSIESDGTLTRGVGVTILDGTESGWGMTAVDASGNHTFYRLFDGKPTGTISGLGLSTHYICKGVSKNYLGLYVGEYCYNQVNSSMYFDGNGYTSTDDWKAWLAAKYAAGDPVIVYYPLETPTETTVEVPVISTEKGSNIVSVETDVKPSNIEMTYRKRTK